MNNENGNNIDIDNTLSDILSALDGSDNAASENSPENNEAEDTIQDSGSAQSTGIPFDVLTMLEMASDLFIGDDADTKNKLALIAALRPFINEERRDSLDIAKKVIKISGLAKKLFTNPKG